MLAEDAELAKNLTPNQRGLILGCCAQVCLYQTKCMQKWTLLLNNMSPEERDNWQRIKDHMESIGKTDSHFYTRACAIVAGNPDPIEPLPTEELE